MLQAIPSKGRTPTNHRGTIHSIMLIKEIRKLLIGKTFSSYDGWHGDSKRFVIGYVTQQKDRFLIAEQKGSPWNKFSVTNEEMVNLIADKYVERRNCIDKCNFLDWFRLI